MMVFWLPGLEMRGFLSFLGLLVRFQVAVFMLPAATILSTTSIHGLQAPGGPMPVA